MEKHVSVTRTPNRNLSSVCTIFLLAVGFAWVLLQVSRSSDSELWKPGDFLHLAAHCESVPFITKQEYLQRQRALAKELHDAGAAAYIAEPGANALYFTNISSAQWKASERPFLLVISPKVIRRNDTDEIFASLTVVTPRFELSRAKTLNIPSSDVHFVTWDEDENPYRAAFSVIQSSAAKPTIFVDEVARYFIADGLQQAARHAIVKISSGEIRALRERKSPAELAILRCANEVTLLAVREVRYRMKLGIRESQTKNMILAAMHEAGLEDLSALVLFGDNAALPHGSGDDRQLGMEDLALFDLMGTLNGYYSDVTRTIALPESRIPPHHLEVWYTVKRAQAAAAEYAREDVKAGDVDAQARTFIDKHGYGKRFTHRLGHGIGIQGHESPYLVGGSDVLLKKGNVFSNEPGVYIEGEVGVRLEDCFYINDQGDSTFLTAGVGGPAISPWIP